MVQSDRGAETVGKKFCLRVQDIISQVILRRLNFRPPERFLTVSPRRQEPP